MADAGVPKIGDVIHAADLEEAVNEISSLAVNGVRSYSYNTYAGSSTNIFSSVNSMGVGEDKNLVEKKAVADALAKKADERLSPYVSRGMGGLDETGYEDIYGEITYHKITKTAGILAGNITFGDCNTLTNRFNLPLDVLRWLASEIPTPSATCFGSWSIEGLSSERVTSLSGSGRVLRLTNSGISFERIYNLSKNGGSTGAWPFSQFSNSRIHFQVVVV